LKQRWRKVLPNYLFVLPYLCFYVLFRLGPDLFGFFVSFHQWEVLGDTQSFIGLGNYLALLHDSLWWLALRNTALFAVLTVAGNLVAGLGAALLVKQNIPGQQFFRVVFYAPVVLSVAVMAAVLQKMLDSQYGLLNYFLAWIGIPGIGWLANPNLVIPSLSAGTVWWNFGFPMLIFLSGLLNIPDHLYEAARIDGADGFAAFRVITLPLLKPVLLFVLVTQFIAHLQVFGQMFIMTQGGPGYASLSTIMYLYQTAWQYYQMGYASSMAFSLAVLIFAITLLNFRLFGQRVEY
jgi:multiple sugar transport system permease protein